MSRIVCVVKRTECVVALIGICKHKVQIMTLGEHLIRIYDYTYLVIKHTENVLRIWY